MSDPEAVVVAGATATGKTALGAALAAALDGEVVCADSRQVFRELEIGTGKPPPAERAARPHHLFDALAVGEGASAGWYAQAAGAALAAIGARGRVAVVVGGTGLWLRALREGLAPIPAADPGTRARIAAELERAGSAALHERLRRDDPETAARLAPRDRQRIARALEVLEATGRPLSWWHGRPRAGGSPATWRALELVLDPAPLARRIERRAQAMFADGLIEEAAALRDAGRAAALRRLRAVGYDEALDVLEGRATREEALARTRLRTVQLAKRQRTWFRHQLDAVRLDAALPAPELAARALAALGA